jgi:hypothetical protein
VFGAPLFAHLAMNPASVAAFFSSCRLALAGHDKDLRSAVTQFFGQAGASLASHRAAQRARDRVEASQFNLFEWIKLDENCLSDIFADLLDPQVGIHGQGTIFLEHLLRIGGVPCLEGLEQAEAWREETTGLIVNPLRRIDILVRLPQFGIGIENRPWAADEEDQVADYVEQMRRSYGKRFLFLYWSGDGRPPTSLPQQERERLERQNQLRVWGYHRELRDWLETSRRDCQSEKVGWFLDDLLSYLARTFVDVSVPSEEEP